MILGKTIYKQRHQGKGVILRYIRIDDAEGLVSMGNSFVKNKDLIAIQTKTPLKKEISYLIEKIKEIKDKKTVLLVIEIDKKIVGASEVKKEQWPSDHIGYFGIILKKEARNMKLGQKLAPIIIIEAKKQLKVKILWNMIYKDSKIAMHFYKKLGFKELGTIKKGIKYYGKYLDRVIMVKYL